MKNREELLKWFIQAKEILSGSSYEPIHPDAVEQLITVINSLEKVTIYAKAILPSTLKNVAYVRLSAWGICDIILPEYHDSDVYKEEILNEDQHLKWNIGIREDFGKGYIIE